MEAPSVVAKAVCVLGAACETDAAKADCTLDAACEIGAAKAVRTPGAACAEKPSAIPRRTAIIATTKREQRLFPTDSPELMSSLSRWWYWHYFTIERNAVPTCLASRQRVTIRQRPAMCNQKTSSASYSSIREISFGKPRIIPQSRLRTARGSSYAR